MSTVTLFIGGRDYAVACADGEEAHVTQLGALIDEKLDQLPAASNQSEVRGLLFAALLLADELSEWRQNPPPAASGERLTAIATQLETIATTLERLASS